MANVSVFGLGYVGCVSAACLAKEGHSVIGVDVNPTKVELINQGKPTVVEEGIGELVAAMHAAGRLRATLDTVEAVASSSISLVCVGTPSKPNGSLDLQYVKKVSTEIGEALRKKNRGRHVVVVRSTVLPGTTRALVIPAIVAASGLEEGKGFGVAMNPEFLREGTSIRDFYDPPFTVIGADDEHTATQVAALYERIEAPLHKVPLEVAEMLKYACNSFHGLKVAFANEIGNVCKALGIDSHRVMQIFCQDNKLNISPAYLRPGFAFGGSCLPKDLRAVTYRARELDISTPVLDAVLESNELQISRAFEMVMATGARRVGVLGLAFKEGTDDLRESPMVALIERLLGKGLQVLVYDREVNSARIIGANREFIEREVPHIWTLLRPTVEEVVSHSETVVLGNKSPEFAAVLQMLRDGQRVVDLARVAPELRSDGIRYEGICW
jgi:GDP-mannose 6-dehydrogenase